MSKNPDPIEKCMGGLCALSMQCYNRGLMHLQVVSSNCISVYAITKQLYANLGRRIFLIKQCDVVVFTGVGVLGFGLVFKFSAL